MGSQVAKSALEGVLALHMRGVGIPTPEREYQFHEDRKWRFDFAWPDLRLAIEVEGVTFYGKNANGTLRLGRHQTAKGFEADAEKYNAAVLDGWSVLRFTNGMIKRGEAIKVIDEWFEKFV